MQLDMWKSSAEICDLRWKLQLVGRPQPGPPTSREECSSRLQAGTEAQPEPSTSYAESDVSAQVESVEPAIASTYQNR